MFRVYNFRIFDKKTFRYFYYTELPKVRYLMSIRHSLIRFATPRFRGKFTCTFVGTGRNVRYTFFIYCRYCSTFPELSRELLLWNHVWNLQWDQMPATKATEEWWEWKEGHTLRAGRNTNELREVDGTRQRSPASGYRLLPSTAMSIVLRAPARVSCIVYVKVC